MADVGIVALYLESVEKLDPPSCRVAITMRVLPILAILTDAVFLSLV